MLDDILDLAGDVLLGISERKSLSPRTKHILEAIAILLGLTSIVLMLRA